MALAMGGVNSLFPSSKNEGEGFNNFEKRDTQDNNTDMKRLYSYIGGSQFNPTSGTEYTLATMVIPPSAVRNAVLIITNTESYTVVDYNGHAEVDAYIDVDGVRKNTVKVHQQHNNLVGCTSGWTKRHVGNTQFVWFTPSNAQKNNGFTITVVMKYTLWAGASNWPSLFHKDSIVIGV